MVAVSHVVFIDESGLSWPILSIQSLWVSTAVAIPFERSRELDRDAAAARTRLFRDRVKELKGHLIKRSELRAGINADAVAAEVAVLLKRYSAHVWTVVTKYGAAAPAGFARIQFRTKDVARQLLLERVNGLLGTGRYAPAHWLMVWDLSDVQELMDISAAASSFANGVTGTPIDPRLYPMVLGGLSHDWGGLQLADVVAHLSLHKVGAELGLPDANQAKAAAFDQHIYPQLQRTATGSVVGWKKWGV